MDKTIISILLRSFATRPSSGLSGKFRVSPSTSKTIENDDIDGNENDLDEYEGDFMNLDKAHVMHEREVHKSRELLARRITRARYFQNEKDPNFITHMEKVQIRALHKSDPKEWTVEKLSNSFPVLPHIVEKIIKSRWTPTSTLLVVKYDRGVQQNWKDFRAGILPVSYQLRVHLAKFKERNISFTDRETLASQLVAPAFQVPEPTCHTFRNILEIATTDNTKVLKIPSGIQKEPSYQFSAFEKIKSMEQSNKQNKRPIRFDEFIEQKMDELSNSSQVRNNGKFGLVVQHVQEQSNKQSRKPIVFDVHAEEKIGKLGKKCEVNEISPPEQVKEYVQEQSNKQNNKPIKVDEFIEQKINKSGTECEVNEITLLEPVEEESNKQNKRQMKFSEFIDQKMKKLSKEYGNNNKWLEPFKEHVQESITSNSKSEHSICSANKKTELTRVSVCNDLEVAGLTDSNCETTFSSKQSNLSTFVKERNSKITDLEDYTLCIKIPKNLYQKGMTYRVNDCYYDDDGQFLFRVM